LASAGAVAAGARAAVDIVPTMRTGWALATTPLLSAGCLAASSIATIHVDTDPAHRANTFRPREALGAGIDRLSTAASDRLFDPKLLAQVLAAGWGAVTYRLNTELHIEAWHWNPAGAWSDAAGERGYFVGEAAPSATPSEHSYGYTLPRRGYTRNEGTEEHGFSRLTDGDPASFWKSNPYLSHVYTGEDDALYPQFIVIDLEKEDAVDALRLDWAPGYPYATAYTVADWRRGPDAMKKPTPGAWVDFPGGHVDGGKGGRDLQILAAQPVKTRYVRVELLRSSESCEAALAGDRRNCLGFAVAEVALGTHDASAAGFHDLLRHSADQQQSATFVSSVDPWHEKATLAARGDQTGFDRFYTSGVTRGLPAMIPVSVLYGVPEDSAHEIAYLEARGYPISYVELGEEPDGQYMAPEHYAQLYLQWATALHAVDPKLKLGGPVFTGQNEDILWWKDARGQASWLGRFVAYLKAHGRLSDLAFVSFEHYPFDPCKVSWKDLYDEPRMIRHVIETYRADGVPADVPLLVTEVNIAWQSSQSFVDAFGGLWLADYIGAFLTAGGAASFYFHYLPWPLDQECSKTWGTFGMFVTDDTLTKLAPTSQYHATRLLTQEWVVPGDAPHEVFPVTSDARDDAGHVVVTAYALARPDGEWSLLVVNKDPASARRVRIRFEGGAAPRAFAGPVRMSVFGPAQYVWHEGGENGHAAPNDPPAAATAPGGADAVYTLPPASVTVLRGRLM
jgi:hypothetical protein